MKHSVILAIAATAIIACGCAQKQEHKKVAPLPAAVSADSLRDCTVAASFTADDFGWMGGNLKLTFYNEDLYDAAEISQLQPGDTIIYELKPMVVTQKQEQDGGIAINGGVEQGGCWLRPGDGGTYVAKIMDDHSVYTPVGKAEVALGQDFVVIDCGEEPTDPMDTISTNQKLYIESLKGYRRDFSPLNTRVLIANGEIKSITRRWIP